MGKLSRYVSVEIDGCDFAAWCEFYHSPAEPKTHEEPGYPEEFDIQALTAEIKPSDSKINQHMDISTMLLIDQFRNGIIEQLRIPE